MWLKGDKIIELRRAGSLYNSVWEVMTPDFILTAIESRDLLNRASFSVSIKHYLPEPWRIPT